MIALMPMCASAPCVSHTRLLRCRLRDSSLVFTTFSFKRRAANDRKCPSPHQGRKAARGEEGYCRGAGGGEAGGQGGGVGVWGRRVEPLVLNLEQLIKGIVASASISTLLSWSLLAQHICAHTHTHTVSMFRKHNLWKVLQYYYSCS